MQNEERDESYLFASVPRLKDDLDKKSHSLGATKQVDGAWTLNPLAVTRGRVASHSKRVRMQHHDTAVTVSRSPLSSSQLLLIVARSAHQEERTSPRLRALAQLSSTAHSYQRRFEPYSDNGGTILAVSSRDFAVIASDTRQSVGYSIQSRYQPRCFQLTDEVVIAVQGFMADSNTLVKRLKQRLEWYFQCVASPVAIRASCYPPYSTNNEYPDLKAVARLVQTMLYGKRFFPFYTVRFTVLHTH
jgi:hypothetical protein